MVLSELVSLILIVLFFTGVLFAAVSGGVFGVSVYFDMRIRRIREDLGGQIEKLQYRNAQLEQSLMLMSSFINKHLPEGEHFNFEFNAGENITVGGDVAGRDKSTTKKPSTGPFG